MMDKYDSLASRYGVELAPFTDSYLNLFKDGLGLLERFIKANRDVKQVSTTELISFVKSEGIQERLLPSYRVTKKIIK